MNPHEQQLRDFEDAFESFRDHEENEYCGEMDYVFGFYAEGVRAWKEQQEQSPIDTREFTNENPGEPLPLLTTPESPLGDHSREYDSLPGPRTKAPSRYETLIMRLLSTRIREHQHHCKSPPAKSTHTLSTHKREEHPHEKRSTRSAHRKRLSTPQERLISQGVTRT